MLILAYLTEGLVRATTDTGTMRLLAGAEVLLATVFFTAAVIYARATRPSAVAKAGD